jgi:hypothetical protein
MIINLTATLWSLQAVAVADVVPWLLTGLAAVAATIAAFANRASAKAQQANVSTEAFEAVTNSQANYNLLLSQENGALRERLHLCEENCRADAERFGVEIRTLEGEVRTLRAQVRSLEQGQ